MPLLTVENLKAGYGKLQILHGVSLNISRGEILSVIGPNGSGKSTLLKSIFGLTTIFDGKISFKGEDITRKKPHEKARMGIAYLPQTDNLFTKLKVKENMLLAGYTLSESEYQERLKEALEFLPQVKEFWERKVWTLSGGERQMVSIAMAVLRKPELYMLDEPTAALAPKIARTILEKIVQLRDTFGAAIILVEQNAKAALKISDNALLLVAGKSVFQGSSSELLQNKELAQMYLGVK